VAAGWPEADAILPLAVFDNAHLYGENIPLSMDVVTGSQSPYGKRGGKEIRYSLRQITLATTVTTYDRSVMP